MIRQIIRAIAFYFCYLFIGGGLLLAWINGLPIIEKMAIENNANTPVFWMLVMLAIACGCLYLFKLIEMIDEKIWVNQNE